MVWQVAAQAGLSALGGILGSRSARKAARERAQAYSDASNIVREAFNESREFLDPRFEQEQAAIGRVNALLGLGGEGPDFSLFRETPGYNFLLDEMQRAVERSAAARGGLVSGNTLTELQARAGGLADQTFSNYLATLMGLQSQGVDQTLAGMRTNLGQQQADFRLGAGGARASGIEGAGAALSGALTGGATALGDFVGRNQLLSVLRPQTVGGPSLPPISVTPVRPWSSVPFVRP